MQISFSFSLRTVKAPLNNSDRFQQSKIWSRYFKNLLLISPQQEAVSERRAMKSSHIRRSSAGSHFHLNTLDLIENYCFQLISGSNGLTELALTLRPAPTTDARWLTICYVPLPQSLVQSLAQPWGFFDRRIPDLEGYSQALTKTIKALTLCFHFIMTADDETQIRLWQ